MVLWSFFRAQHLLYPGQGQKYERHRKFEVNKGEYDEERFSSTQRRFSGASLAKRQYHHRGPPLVVGALRDGDLLVAVSDVSSSDG